jgi:glycosyltransferase involved in cell wall biosynthesis
MVGATSVRTVHGEPEFVVSIWQFRKKLYSLADRLCGRYIQKAIIAVSQDLGQKLRQVFPTGRIAVITNSIDTEEVLRCAQDHIALAPEESALRVGIIGRLVPVKRMDLFVAIAGELKALFPGRFRFLILGEGPLMADIKFMIRAKGLADFFDLPGSTENALPYIKSMDLLLITSDSEGLPMTLLEAMCLATPVIARAVGGIPAVLCNGKYGDLVQSAEPREFVDVISQYLVKREIFYEKARKAREHALVTYSVDRAVTEYALLYERLAGTR